MAEPICEDEGLLQEWSPQIQLLQQIPLKLQRGLFPQNLSLTCVDVISDYVVLGTNLGFVYWYCRVNGELQRLRFENSHCAVTCIKVVCSVDYMVAAGSDQGTVAVFQIPKATLAPTSDGLKLKQKKIERFTINGLHNAPITSVEWSQNELKVFTGDKNGVVVLTEIDLNLHISKSMALLNEQFEITQLSFAQQILLISTVFRSIICDGSNNWKVLQVGTKERKILGKFGATFCKFQHGLVVYASRPGHRLWLSDTSGVVQQTLIFKSSTQSNCPRIQLINPIEKKEPYDTSFGKVIQFSDNKLITYNSEIMYVLHPGAVSVVSLLSNARKILDLAVHENEIFILEGERSLLRISPLPDKYTLDMLYQPISRRTSFNLDELAAKLKDTAVESLKKITKDLIISPEEISPNSPPVMADEAMELPAIVNLPAGALPAIYAGENIEIYSSVKDTTIPSGSSGDFGRGNSPMTANNVNPFVQDCQEEVITRPLRKRHYKKSKILSQSQESISDNVSNPSEDRLVWGVANDLSLSDESTFSQSQSSFSVLRDIPTLLTSQTLMKAGNDEAMISSDIKSQASLDTCESVSERLLMTSEMFREEQEKTFARLANQSLLDSFNSEGTDNMSISLNMTTSSSVSSKISENLNSPSYTSENSGVGSRAKSTESQSTDNLPPENCSRSGSNIVEKNFSQEDRVICSSESSPSSRNSQRERLYPRWTEEESEIAERKLLQLEKNFAYADNEERSKKESGFYESNCPKASCGSFSKLSETTHGAPGKSEYSQEDHQSEKENKENKKENEFSRKPFESLELLSYGPPSGSSLLSSQPSSDFSSMGNNSQILQLQVGRDASDHWPQYKTPDRITSLSASKHYVICTDVNDKVYYSNLCGLALLWTLLDYKASMVRVSNDGSVVWMLVKKSLMALVNLYQKSPISGDFVEIAENVKTFSIDSENNDGWIVTLKGKVVHYDGVHKRLAEKSLPCDFIVIDVACYKGMVIALTNDDTILCKPSTEDKFRMIKTPEPSISSIALGPDELLWIVSEASTIHFSDDYLGENPRWWQVHISDYIFQNSSRPFQNICNKIKLNDLKVNIQFKNTFVTTNESSVWIYDKFASCVCVNKTGFTGYIWDKVSSAKIFLSIQWSKVSAEGVFEDKGRVWMMSVTGDIFCTSPNHHQFQSLPVPSTEKILCITSSTNTLWVLSETGVIYSRLGLTESNISGVSWKELRPPLIDNLRLIWVSCGCDVAWACDVHGRTFMALASQQEMASLSSGWQEVEGRPKDVQFEKVFVGTQLYMVWAIDNKRNLYVREGIFADYEIGTSWVYVCGIEAVHVTISGTSVWALSSNGNVYRRCGVSESNYIGDYWKSIPGTLKMISSSFTDELWGISQENKILRLSCNLKTLKENGKNKEIYCSKEDVSWEIVE